MNESAHEITFDVVKLSLNNLKDRRNIRSGEKELKKIPILASHGEGMSFLFGM